MGSNDRRQFVKLLGAAAAASGVAGCSQVPGGGGGNGTDGGNGGGNGNGDADGTGTPGEFGGGDLPSYSSWLPAPANDPAGEPYILMAAETKTFQKLQSDNTPTPTPEDSPTATATPGALVRNPLVALITLAFGAGFGLAGVGLNNVASGENSPTDQFLLADQAIVLLGSYDPEALGKKVTEKGGLSEAGSAGNLTMYTGEDGQTVVAIGDSAIVFTSKQDDQDKTAKERVKTVASVGAGDAPSVAEGPAALTWALSTAGKKGAVFGMTTTDAAMDTTPTPTPTPDQGGGFGFPSFSEKLFRGAKAGVQSMDISKSSVSTIAAIQYPEGESPPADQLRSVATGPKMDVKLRTRGNRAILKASRTMDN